MIWRLYDTCKPWLKHAQIIAQPFNSHLWGQVHVVVVGFWFCPNIPGVGSNSFMLYIVWRHRTWVIVLLFPQGIGISIKSEKIRTILNPEVEFEWEKQDKGLLLFALVTIFFFFKIMSWFPSILQRQPLTLVLLFFFFSVIIKARDLNILEVFQFIVVIILLHFQLFHFGQLEYNQLGTSIFWTWLQ